MINYLINSGLVLSRVLLPLQEHILNKAGIKELVGMRKDNVGKGGETSAEMTTQYLRELPPKLFEQLLRIYQYDLEIFGYEMPKLKLE